MSASDNSSTNSLSYRDAGVDIAAGNALVDDIKSIAKSTHRPEVIGGLGGFGALCKLPTNYNNPVLVAGTDGVGTKLKLALDTQRHEGVGIDLVAMCVNDLVVAGAEPLFFLDYYATAKLDVPTAASVVASIGEGCRQAGAALIGGETAEMPGMYAVGDYDLAGFCVGVVEEDGVIDGSQVAVGDSIIALGSSGPHSNGYSLIRKVIEHANADLNSDIDNGDGQSIRLVDALLEPTRIYVKSLLAGIKALDIRAIAHITGGGLLENIPRVLPAGSKACINTRSWQLPPIFQWLQMQGNIVDEEMHRAFNCGVGMVVVVPQADAEEAIRFFQSQGERAWLLGEIAASDATQPHTEMR